MSAWESTRMLSFKKPASYSIIALRNQPRESHPQLLVGHRVSRRGLYLYFR
jgi:hypothetical protein